jgi:thiol-disulfide isomerase/thioredoxin
MKVVWSMLAFWGAVALAQQPPTILNPGPPSDAEQKDLSRALTDGSTSAVDMIRSLEAHLAKYPNSAQRKDLEAALTKAAIDANDPPRIVKYGIPALEAKPDDVLFLDRVSRALLAIGGKDNAAQAYRYARALEDLIAGIPPATGRDAARLQDERDRAQARALLYQARAKIILEEKDEVIRLAGRAFDKFPGEEPAREWAEALVRAGREEESVTHFADAFVIPDPFTNEVRRQEARGRAGEVYAKLHGSEKGLGDLILQAYDRTSTIVQTRRTKLMALDPNAAISNPLEVTLTRLDGRKVPLSSFQGKVLVLDFWATWCLPCRTQHPLYEKVKERFGDRSDLVFLAINADEDQSLVEPFLFEQQWDKTIYFENGLVRLLNVTNIPTTILFDKQGRIASRMNGFIPDTFVDQLSDRIRATLDNAGN